MEAKWYGKETGCGGQGLIIDEATGANIAVVYEEKYVSLLSAAPAMYEACWAIETAITPDGIDAALVMIRKALSVAEGRE